MGVTLERVQNKFACIIGELCNEPYVLSQFAIWVDLRIAEYKAKGSIALDCTGNIPEPTWLKGLNPPAPIQSDLPLHRGLTTVRSKSPRHKRHGLGHSPTAMLHPTSDTSHLQERDTGDSDILELVVKNEPQEVFPVSLHVHDRLSADRTNSRKRASAQDQDVLHSDNSIFPTSASTPSKSRRLSSHSDNSFSAGGQDSVSNQSFLSVIGIGEQPSTSSISDQAGDALLTVQRYEASQISEEDQSVGADPSISTSSQSVTSCGQMMTSHSDGSPSADVNRHLHSERNHGNRWKADGVRESGGQSIHESGAVSFVDVLSSPTYKNSIYSVNTLHAWLRDQGESRDAHVIPADLLDSYLSSFFKTVRQKNGSDYKSNSLISLRKFLNLYLKGMGYPHSIVKSEQFSASQRAFRERLLSLEMHRYPRAQEGTAWTGHAQNKTL
ncbi:uncharacterized protein LOC135463663 isoform X2 [Liolophura sinensis]|uniref:uncharacterized protein LOC135463663 isoform X2 n=1 Tax=Liolophura sinensis TaxID=3198878 RepID=UPI003157F339